MKTKKMFLFLPAMYLASLFGFAVEGERFLQSEQAVQEAAYGHIDAKGLKSLLESQTPLTLLDARGNQWHDGFTIPGAVLAWYEDSLEEFERIIPDKQSLVVVYCFSFTCPLSPRLAQKLIDLGYTNVLEYPAGLKEWRDIAHYPVVPIQ
jgi:rhodanese-related sulfurtransferase